MENYHRARLQTNFSSNNNTVDFSNGLQDYVNVRTQLLSKQLYPIYYINIFCLGKGDEAWLGIINKDAFTSSQYVRCHRSALLYYGGRESDITYHGASIESECAAKQVYDPPVDDCNHGGIQGKGQVIKHPIEAYQAGDWINFEIDLINKTVVFSKNGMEQYRITDEFFPNQDCYFMVTLDEPEDKYYIEQAFDRQLV